MKLDNKYSFKVMEGLVKYTRKLDIFSSLPHFRGCASSKPSLPGPNSETCIVQSPRWISQQGALSRAEEFYGPALEEGTDCKAGCLDCQFFMRCSKAYMEGPMKCFSRKNCRQCFDLSKA